MQRFLNLDGAELSAGDGPPFRCRSSIQVKGPSVIRDSEKGRVWDKRKQRVLRDGHRLEPYATLGRHFVALNIA